MTLVVILWLKPTKIGYDCIRDTFIVLHIKEWIYWIFILFLWIYYDLMPCLSSILFMEFGVEIFILILMT